MTPAPTGTPGAGGKGGAASQPAATQPAEVLKTVNDRTFVLRNNIWIDTQFDSTKMKPIQVKFLSDEYFKLLTDHPEIKDYLALGEHVVIVIGTDAYEIVSN